MCSFEVCSSLILRNKNDPFLSHLITCDEKWILYDNCKRTGQWLDKNEAPKLKLIPKNVMVTVWWSAVGAIHYKFMKLEETINSESYCQVLEEMYQKLSQKMPALTLQKLNELGYETLPYPAYSSDLASTDFHFFKHLDNFLTEKIFRNDEDIKTAFEVFIESRTPDFYANGINKLVSRWQQCVDSNGSYFE
uniref:Histone-lysine N-methyltransferase SETMAR n=1 Tax=Strongyloides papillosus TaxID=174720 RepID=A0A0N5BH16_STREA